MTEEIIISGFGGQGIMLMGQLLAYAGMLENKQVSWIPSYGPEMRGGTANCSTIISENPIGAPTVSEPTAVVAMNLPSIEKFETAIQPGGILIINSSLVEWNATRTDLRVYQIPANEISLEFNNSRVSNMVILGALVTAIGTIQSESVIKAFAKIFAKKTEILWMNEQAILRGSQYITALMNR
ncbi:2-oxoacid:acceptor oxidoreductase family protein [Pelosinus sp. IPA-1]|uniref:2-oxoacid:acceptor oxidoreductase family protein n=1 Tax=Pelosinus sp. IPA-1 TaxID=3029569 RepID=UPI0024362411|nr:2-oxoacid:acceptor oxidoreductase family protein [Pelosinus sp. IPA-1]GMA99600.1 2-oxoglutarate ferredoxin oxidoreductase subunit gamma [Pelosinus sp. IPA-1]